jgi:serine/threonine-protein kinase
MNVTLTVHAGPHTGESFEFTEHDTFMVGRGEDVHFRLPDDPSMSRKHFLLEINPPLCRLHDLKSRTGTKVNGRKVETADVTSGDLIQAGQTVFMVSVDPTGEPDPEATVDPSTQTGDDSTPAWHWPERTPTIPGYEIRKEAARGGMGVVYEAVRRSDHQVVAIKTLLPAVSPTHLAVERFLREARILQELNHPHIVRFLDMGELNRLLWFAMEFVPGTDVSRNVKANGPFDIAEGVRLGLQLIDALTYAHAKKFVHRDIKPSNLLLSPRSDGRFDVKLSDFGLARTYQASQLSGLTVTGTSAGTPLYMSPEQVRNFRDVKPPADQYAAAATLYFMLTGHPVFDPSGRDYVSTIMGVLDGMLVPIRDRRATVPEGLAQVIHQGLKRYPDDRFPDVHAFGKGLRPFAAT